MTVSPLRAAVAPILLLALGCAPRAEPPVVLIPVAPPPPSEPADLNVPFAGGQVWTGTYVCAQGETALWLHVVGVAGNDVRATFDFAHVPSGARGEYEVAGRYDPAARRLVLVPGRWLLRQEGYVTVGMSGRVSPRGTRFQGTITYPTCGAFSVELGGSR